MSLIVSVSGLRGVVGKTLTPLVAARYAASLAPELGPGALLVTRDGRSHGDVLARAVAAALAATGRDVLDGGVAATPTTGVLVRELRLAGALQVSASHNPAEYNGLKAFGADGRVLPAAAGLRVRHRFEGAEPAWAPWDAVGGVSPLNDTTTAHLRLIERAVDVDAIRRAGFRVLLDANHGAGAVLGGPLLDALGCEATVLGAEPDGAFEHPPEPTAENLARVAPRVAALGCAVGFCQDPDADRLALIDERGRYVGEEATLALAVDHVLRTRTGPVVTNCSTSRMTELIAKRHGAPFYRSAVGEANVVDAMLAHGALIGGEGNGGVIDPRVGLVRDSYIGAALVLEMLAARGEPLSALVDQLPRLAIHKTKVTLAPSRTEEAFAALERAFPDAAADRLDGLRLDWPDRWLLVRASNTEPIVRIIAEAESAAQAERACDAARAALAGLT